MASRDGRRRSGLWYLLLLPPFIGLLWPALYARARPTLGGFPFFYWYQLVWVLAVAALTGIVYWLVGD